MDQVSDRWMDTHAHCFVRNVAQCHVLHSDITTSSHNGAHKYDQVIVSWSIDSCIHPSIWHSVIHDPGTRVIYIFIHPTTQTPSNQLTMYQQSSSYYAYIYIYIYNIQPANMIRSIRPSIHGEAVIVINHLHMDACMYQQSSSHYAYIYIQPVNIIGSIRPSSHGDEMGSL